MCLPKNEGGLGIRSISDVNKSLMANHIWSIITNRDSIWVRWIHDYKLKGRNFWEIPCRGSMSWGWRKILSIRHTIRPHIWSSVQSGIQTNVWSDMWCSLSPLSEFISPRAIANAGFSLQSSVADVIDQNGHWKWPQAWLDLFPVLFTLSVPNLVPGTMDRLVWKDLNGKMCEFQSAQVWDTIRSRENQVMWTNMVWFSQCILRHSFHLWLAFRNKLKTQDRLTVWEAGSLTNLNLMACPLCYADRESRDHLFFRCSFADQVWNNVKTFVQLGSVDNSWDSLLLWVDQHSSSKKADHVVCKLLIAASSYYIWQERNNKIFKNQQRTIDQVAEVIQNSVRLRLMGFRFRLGSTKKRIFKLWKIEENEDNVALPG
ncbi:putative reverse transcriptase zinc-binding domain-containing protein [Helianthus anomalus]